MDEKMVKKEYYDALRMRADRLEALCKKLREQNKELEKRNEYLWKVVIKTREVPEVKEVSKLYDRLNYIENYIFGGNKND